MKAESSSRAGTLLGRRLRRYRGRRPLKWTAAELGVSVSEVSRWERGVRLPAAEHIDLISTWSGIPISCLFCDRYDTCLNGRGNGA